MKTASIGDCSPDSVLRLRSLDSRACAYPPPPQGSPASGKHYVTRCERKVRKADGDVRGAGPAWAQRTGPRSRGCADSAATRAWVPRNHELDRWALSATPVKKLNKRCARRVCETPRTPPVLLFSATRQTGALEQMNLSSILEPIQHVSFAIDDSSLALMALLAGMIGGWRITGWRQQMKLKRARIERKPDRSARKPD